MTNENKQLAELEKEESENKNQSLEMVSDSQISILKEKFKVVPDEATVEGYKLIKSSISKIKMYITNTEKLRKKRKAEYLEGGRLVDSQAKKISNEINEIMKPFVAAKKRQDEIIEKIKQDAIQKGLDRIKEIEGQISSIKELENNLLTASSDIIQSRLDILSGIDISESKFSEFYNAAESASNEVLENLTTAYNRRLNFEIQEKEQAERQKIIDAQLAELDARQEKIDAEELERTRESREKKIAEEAAENAKREAEEKASARETELKQQAENAQREAKETEMRIIREQKEKEDADHKEAMAREADKNHKEKINNDAVAAFVLGGMSEAQAKKAVILIAKREIPNVVISY